MSCQAEATAAFVPLIETVGKRCFQAGAAPTDTECLGIAVAQYCNWDGEQILRLAMAALTEANYHREAGDIQAMLQLLDAMEPQMRARLEQASTTSLRYNEQSGRLE